MTLDPRRPVDDLRLLSDRLRAIEDRLDRLAAPSGTQAARSVATLIAQQALLGESFLLLSRIDDDAERDSTSGFAITTSATVRATEVYTNPAYATRCTVTILGNVTGRNQTGFADILRAKVLVATPNGPGSGIEILQTAADDHYASLAPSYTFDIELEASESLTFTIEVRTVSGTWAADSANQAQISYVVNARPMFTIP